jgi:hypothetical protein
MARTPQKLIRWKDRVLFILSFVTCLICGWKIAYALWTLRFIPTVGVVLNSCVEQTGGGSPKGFRPIVAYKYQVGRREYQNDSYQAIEESGSQKWAQDVVSDYTPGTLCKVYHDPTFPSLSILINRLDSVSFVGCCFGELFFSMYVVYFFFKLRSTRLVNTNPARQRTD